MPDDPTLTTVNTLTAELLAINRVIANFDAGGRITSMIVSGGGDPQQLSQAVQTTEIDYPPQMVDVIKAALDDRQRKIRDRLASLGVTGAAR